MIEMKEDRIIDFKTNNYSLALLIYALDNSGIKDFTIVQEENDLHIRISKKHIDSIVFRQPMVNYEDCVAKGV